MRRVRKKFGFTLLEIIVVIAMISIVIGAAFSLFFYEIGIFNHGSNQSSLQFETRMLSDKITNKLRLAADLQLTNSGSGVYINETNLNDLYTGLETSYIYSLSFHAKSNPKLVGFILTTTDPRNNQTFSIETEVALLNSSINLVNSPVVNNPYSTVVYTEPTVIP